MILFNKNNLNSKTMKKKQCKNSFLINKIKNFYFDKDTHIKEK